MLKRIIRRTLDLMAAHPRISMAAVAVGASFTLSMVLASVDGGHQALAAHASGSSTLGTSLGGASSSTLGGGCC